MRIAEKSVFRRISTKLYAQHQACDINAPAGEHDQQQQNHIQRAVEVLHLFRAGADNALQMVTWFVNSKLLVEKMKQMLHRPAANGPKQTNESLPQEGQRPVQYANP